MAATRRRDGAEWGKRLVYAIADWIRRVSCVMRMQRYDQREVEMGPDSVTEEVSANVRMVTSPDELVVTNPAARSVWTPLLSMTWIFVLLLSLIFSTDNCGRAALRNLLHFRWNGDSIFLALCFIVFIWKLFQLSRQLFGGNEILRCTRSELAISNIDFGRVWRHRSFAVADVKKMEFAVFGFSKFSKLYGLRFDVDGSRVVALRGLKAVEAQKILEALKNLGLETIADPAMRMAVEMELDRRKSPLGLRG